jgi:hypothetical protein
MEEFMDIDTKAAVPKLRYRVDLTKAEETAIVRAYADELIADKTKGVAFLQRAGILDENGHLTEIYRRTE